MKTLEIVGYNRDGKLGGNVADKLRKEGYVPCVLYSTRTLVHFYAPMILFRELLYTPEAYFVNLNIEGKEYKAILQAAQFHPISEIIMHVDFLELIDDKPVTMELPIKLLGTPIGMQKGGRLEQKLRRAKVRALPANMPAALEINIADLDLGKSVKVADIKAEGFEILNNSVLPVATVAVTRTSRKQEAGA